MSRYTAGERRKEWKMKREEEGEDKAGEMIEKICGRG